MPTQAKHTSSKRPIVTIHCATFNHHAYIAEAVKSFVDQKTNFPVEIIIHDDASTDGTTVLLQELANAHPNIKLLVEEKNQYSRGDDSFVRAMFRMSRGKYIAVCEGDDFWTDASKLQRQVDFLESHTDYALCFHPVRVFFEDNSSPESIFPDPNNPNHFTTVDLLNRNFIQSNSVMYRRQKYKDFATGVTPLDWYTHLYHAQFGKIGFINRVMSAYRRHPGGLWWNTHANLDEIWRKHGLGHLALYAEMLKMYGKEPALKNEIYEKINNLMTRLYVIDQKGLFTKANRAYPEFSVIHSEWLRHQIEERAQKIAELQSQLGQKEESLVQLRADLDNALLIINERDAQIHSILSSRSWKVISAIRKLLHPFGPR